MPIEKMTDNYSGRPDEEFETFSFKWSEKQVRLPVHSRQTVDDHTALLD